MKKFKGTIWTAKPNFKKILKDQQNTRYLKIAVILYFILGLLVGILVTQ